MNFASVLRLLQQKTARQALRRRSNKPSARRRSLPALEVLEVRELLANDVPFIVAQGVRPLDGTAVTIGQPPLQVQYSERMGSSAAVANNYVLIAAAGTTIPINTATLDATGTIVTLTYNGGQELPVATSTLFVRGDRVFDVDDNFPLASPDQLIVASSSRNSLSVVDNTGDGTLAAVSNHTQNNALGSPFAIATADFDGDGLPDMAVVNRTTSQVSIFQGRTAASGGGFNPTAGLVIGLIGPGRDIVVADLNNDGKPDFGVAFGNSVSAFLNTRVLPATLSFSQTRKDLTGTPVDLVAADLDGDGRADLAAAISDATGDLNGDMVADFRFAVLRGDAAATLANPVYVRVGDVMGNGVTNPTSLTTGLFNSGDSRIDVAVGGSNGIVQLFNNSPPGSVVFALQPARISNSSIVALGSGTIAGTIGTAILATTTTNELHALYNDGTGTFAFSTFAVPAGAGGQLTLADVNIDGRLDAVITNGADAGRVSVLLGQNTIGGVISNATNASPIVVTSRAHGLTSGRAVVISGAQGNTAANGAFIVTVIDANTFSLNGSTGNGTYTGGGSWALAGAITSTTGAGNTPIVVTSAAHGLSTGHAITISGSPFAAANGTFTITVIDANSFSLNGTTLAGGGAGGTWVTVPRFFAPAGGANVVDAVPVGVAVVDTNQDGRFDLVTANNTGQDLTRLLGNGNGTFRQSAERVLPNPTTQTVTVSDVNRDGVQDLIVVNNNLLAAASFVSVLLGQRSGGYAASFDYSPSAPGRTVRDLVNVSLGDVNGDNRLDILVVDRAGSAIGILLNNIVAPGGALDANSFTAIQEVSVGARPYQVVAGDFNQDGRRDLAVAHAELGGNPLLKGVTIRLGNGNGTFQAATEQLVGVEAVALALADFNRDGLDDLAVVDSIAPGSVRLLRGNGFGGFTNVGAFNTLIPNPNSIAVTDFNRDGFLDVVVTTASTNTTNAGVAVLLNQLGNNFGGPLQTDVVPGTALNSVAVTDVNLDGLPDIVAGTSLPKVNGVITAASNAAPIVITSTGHGLSTGNQVQITGVQGNTAANGTFTITVLDANSFSLDGSTGNAAYTSGGLWTLFGTANTKNNLFALVGVGNGTFRAAVPYQAGGFDTLTPTVSRVVATPSALVRATTFTVGGNRVDVNLIRNGDFEAVDLTGEQGNLLGWRSFRLATQVEGSHGRWGGQTGTQSPLSLTDVPGPSGNFRAMLDQANLQPLFPDTPPFLNPNPASSYEGTHVLYQDFTIPSPAIAVSLNLRLFIDNLYAGFFTDPVTNPSLDYRTPQANQQVRIDLISPTADLLTSSTGVLRTLFQTTGATGSLLNFSVQDADLRAFAGQTIRLRIAVANNLGQLLVGIDDVQIVARFLDNVAPTLTGVAIRNPAFFSGPVAYTTDPTIVGTVADATGVNGIAAVQIDVNGDGFGGFDDITTTQWDVNGQFSITLPTAPIGLNTVGVRVVDLAGNQTSTTLTFYVQPQGPTSWQATGFNGIDVTNQGVDYTTVSGRITATVADLSDSTGNTYIVGSATGGIWRTTNGGRDWRAVTDAVLGSTGQVISVPVGGLAQSRSNPNVLYAALGVADQQLDSRPGSGVLKSTDGGRTWVLVGNSATVLADVRVSKVVVDANDANIAYVAVASGGAEGPGVYRTTNGGQTWSNVLVPTQMFLPNGQPLPAGTELASVTDMVIDPFNSDRLLIGLGNIGLLTANATAGVWRTANRGGTWDLIDGSGSLPTGTALGKVTVAMGTGRVGDERVVYVLISSPPVAGAPPLDTNYGSADTTVGVPTGLYKTSNNLLGFLKVGVRQRVAPFFNAAGAVLHTYADLNFTGRNGANTGVLVVDPTNPNVVFVGGSTLYGSPVPNRSFIRIDTGNMNGSGDDIDKVSESLQPFRTANRLYDPALPVPPNPPPPGAGVDMYTKEGVFWYDLDAGDTHQRGFLDQLPETITSLTFDALGRLLVGTDNGIWRGLDLGFGYDFTGGWNGDASRPNPTTGGIFATREARLPVYTAPGMTFTSLNGNLQIVSQTSTAIDPIEPGVLHSTEYHSGTAQQVRPGVWTSIDLFGPNSQTAANVHASAPPPGLPAGTPVTLFRNWRYASPGAILPQYSVDGGFFWTTRESAGLPTTLHTAVALPPLAINPVPVFESGEWQNELLLGTNRVWLTRTSTSVWDPISGVLSMSPISALAFAPSQRGVYYAGTAAGEVFVTFNSGGDLFLSRGAGLPGGRINGITVDPNNHLVAYALFDGAITGGSVWRTTDGGLSWSSVSNNLPPASAYKLVVAPEPGLGASVGKLYVATEVGVFFSVNNGATWAKLGLGQPNAPVVDLDYDLNLQILVAATRGRSVYTISTAAISVIPDQTILEDTATRVLPISINDPGLPAGSYTVTATSSNTLLVPNNPANLILGGSGAERSIRIVPVANQIGTTTITITVTAGAQVFTETFQLNVIGDNDLPVISPIGKQFIAQSGQLIIPFTVSDVETPPDMLTVQATSSNQAVIPAAGVLLGGSGTNRTLTLTPAAGVTGETVITITVTDLNGGVTIRTIPVLVTATRTLPFADNFNRPDSVFLGVGWNENFGDFGVSANAGRVNSAYGVATVNGVSAADVSVAMDVDLAVGQAAGLVARYTGTGDQNLYWGAINRTASGATVSIWRGVNGVFTQLTSRSVGSAAGTLMFEVAGPSLKLFLNNTLVAFAQDTLLSGPGSVGVRASQGVSFDNFTSVAAPLNPVTLPFADTFTTATNQQLSNSWVDRVGNYAVFGGLAQGADALNVATLHAVNAANVAVQTDINLTLPGQSAGLVARYAGQGDQNMYWGAVSRSGASFTAAIWRNVNGTWTSLTSQGTGSGTGTLRFEASGPSLKLFLNGNLIAFAQDTAHTTGTVGLRVTGGVTADNFAASVVPTNLVTLPFADNFNTAVNQQLNSANWTDQAGNVRVDGGTATGQTSVNVAVLNGVNTANVAVQAAVNLGVGQVAGLVARHTGAGDRNLYWGALSRSASGTTASIWRAVNGSFTQIASGAAASGTGTLRFEASGPSLKLFLDGTLVAFAQDATHTTGSVGIRTGQGAALDDFAASVVTVNVVTLPFSDGFTAGANGQLNSASWTEQAGNFQVVTPIATGQAPVNVAVLNGVSAANVSVQAFVALGVGEAAGLVARHTGTGDQNLYWGALSRTASGTTASIWRAVNGVFTQIATGTAASGSGLLRFEVSGPSLKLFLNGGLVAFAQDTAISGPGSVGIRTGQGADLDSFSAESVPVNVVALPFADNFNTAVDGQLNRSNWTDQAGNIRADGVNAIGQAAVNVAVLNGVNTANVVVQADVTLDVGEVAGLVARYTGTGDRNLYWGALSRSASGTTASIWRAVNGSFTQIASGAAASGTGTLRFEVNGPSLQLFLNGTLVAFAQDTAISGPGSVGVRTGQGAALDNFAADQLTPLNPTLPFSDDFNTAFNERLNRNWTDQVGNFRVNGGVASGNAAVSLASLNGVLVGNISTQAFVTVAVGQTAGLVARYTGTGLQNLYFGALSNTSGGVVASIWRVVNGVATQIGSGTAGGSTGTLRFEVAGASLKLFLGGTLIAFAQDTALNVVGSTGMIATAGATFDNFTTDRITLLNPALPFIDDFNTAIDQQLGRNWTDQAGNIRVNGNATGRVTVNVATLNGVSAADVSVQASVNLGVGQVAGLVARYTGTGDQNLYWGALSRTASGLTASIWRAVNGVFTQIASGAAASGTGLLVFDVVGTSLRLSLGGVLVATATDTALTAAGSVGIRTGQDGGVDDFTAAVLPTTTPVLPYTDNFNTATNQRLSTDWVERAGAMRVSGGAAQGFTGLNLATLNGISVANAAVAAVVNVAAAGQTAGLVARYVGTGDSNMYFAALANTGTGFVGSIWRNLNGTWTQLASAAASAGTGTLLFEVVGTSLKLFLSGNLVTFAHDSALTGAGSVGLRSTQGAGYDNFNAAVITPVNQTLPFSDNFNAPVNAQLSNVSWLERAGNFRLTSGFAQGNAPLSLATVNGINVANADVQADVSVALAGQTAGLVARYGGPGDQSMYFGSLANTGSGFVATIWRNLNGTWTQLASAAVGTGTGLLRFQVVGTALRLFLNGSQVVTANDTALSSGGIGIRATLGGIVDNFQAS